MPWRRILLEKLTVHEIVEKFLALYRAQMFITAFTRARYLSLESESIQFMSLILLLSDSF